MELLEKGEQNGKLVATDQYILSEFIGKYVVSLINDEKIL